MVDRTQPSVIRNRASAASKARAFIILRPRPRPKGRGQDPKAEARPWGRGNQQTGCPKRDGWQPKNGGVSNSPKSSNFNRDFHYFHHPFWGVPPIFGNTHVESSWRKFKPLMCVGMPPLPSDHQDDITCLAKDSYKPSFPTVTKRGTSQRILVDIDPSGCWFEGHLKNMIVKLEDFPR